MVVCYVALLPLDGNSSNDGDVAMNIHNQLLL
jgi:hypothetical protein